MRVAPAYTSDISAAQPTPHAPFAQASHICFWHPLGIDSSMMAGADWWFSGRANTLPPCEQAKAWALTFVIDHFDVKLAAHEIASVLKVVGGGCPKERAVQKWQTVLSNGTLARRSKKGEKTEANLARGLYSLVKTRTLLHKLRWQKNGQGVKHLLLPCACDARRQLSIHRLASRSQTNTSCRYFAPGAMTTAQNSHGAICSRTKRQRSLLRCRLCGILGLMLNWQLAILPRGSIAMSYGSTRVPRFFRCLSDLHLTSTSPRTGRGKGG